MLEVFFMYPNPGGHSFFRRFSFLKDIDFAGLLDGASKTLSVVHQAIPVYQQVKPILSNLRTFSQIGNIFQNDDALEEKNSSSSSSIFYV